VPERRRSYEVGPGGLRAAWGARSLRQSAF